MNKYIFDGIIFVNDKFVGNKIHEVITGKNELDAKNSLINLIRKEGKFSKSTRISIRGTFKLLEVSL